ncbi:MAG: DEAD/DEAH box helicase, partial [Solirubrobacteraceae bacterium]
MKDGRPRADHLSLLRELYALHRLGRGRYNYYGYGTEPTIDLGGCDSRQLWSLLREAERIGLALVHRTAPLGEVRLLAGELALDLTRAGGGDHDGEHVLSARLALDDGDGTGLEPIAFLGASGHGAVCIERYAEGPLEDRRIALVQLRRPAPERLRRQALDGTSVSIPHDQLARFATRLYPSLRHLVTVISSDGSFQPPEISAPALVLRVRHGDRHETEAGWGWRYTIGDQVRVEPLDGEPDESGVRDPAAERAILQATAIVDDELASWGLVDSAGRPAGRPVTLAGLETMRFATEALPRLASVEGIEIETEGEPAAYRDVSEELTIGVSTAEIGGQDDWFDLGVTIAVQGRELPFVEVFAALARGESRLLLDDGAHFSLREPRLETLRQLIEEAQGLSDAPPGELRISRWQAGLWSELAALGIVTAQAQAWERQVDRLLALDGVAPREPPAGVRAELRPYQREGFAWLAALWEHELGGILADDMGLGKTVQALALICHARDAGERRPFLVVAPTSVVPGWVAEAARFTPGLRVTDVLDTTGRSGRSLAEIAAGADIVVTTYTLFRLDADGHREVQWAGLILDEAQNVKNHQAATHRCARRLQAPFKLAITGTPMENSLMELWAILSISAPGLFPDPTRFSHGWARPIERRGDGELLARLRRRIKPLVRR